LNFTLNALQRLSAENELIRQRAAHPPVDGQRACHGLNGAIQKLREKWTTVKFDRPKANALSVWAEFAAVGYNTNELDGLRFRTLCSSEETALRPEFVEALSRSPERLMRSRCLYGMVNSYFSNWRLMNNPDAVERLLISIFARYDGKNSVVRKWEERKALFSDQAATLLAEEIWSGRKAVDEVLKIYYVGPLTKLGLSTRAAAAISASEHLRQQEQSWNVEWALSYLRWITESVLSDLTLPDAFSYAVSSLILCDSAKRSDAFQRALRSFIQNDKRLGDPRVRETSLNWRTITSEAAQRYLSCLARDSIIFFFNSLLPNTSENRRRKDFWLKYQDRIKDFQVAVSEDDALKLRASRQSPELLSYSHVDHPTTSAFLMKFEGYGGHYLVVEFSETGNAAYIFDFAAFESKRVSLRTHRFDLRRHLKFDKTHRIIHNGGWEAPARSMLAANFGIKP